MSLNLDNLKLAVRLANQLSNDQLNFNCVIDSGKRLPIITGGKPSVECGAIGCVIGWCTALPEFQQQGVSWTSMKGLMINDVPVYAFEKVANHLFNMSQNEARNLFGVKGDSAYDLGDLNCEGENSHITDKEIFERRLSMFCADKEINPAIFD